MSAPTALIVTALFLLTLGALVACMFKLGSDADDAAEDHLNQLSNARRIGRTPAKLITHEGD